MEKYFDHHLYKFDSGLRLVVVPMPNSRTATVMVLAGTGNNYEIKEQAGIAHFLEHMMFKGTTNRPDKLAISYELDSIGANYNAFTSREKTGYHAQASAGKVEILMDVVYDIFLNSLIDQKEVEVERGVIHEELRMYRDEPKRYVSEIFDKVMYDDQPAGWGIEEELTALKNLSRDKLKDYFNNHYISKNTVVGIAGNINPEMIREKTERYFKNIRNGELFKKPKVIESQNGPNALVHFKETDQTHFIIGLRAYNLFDEKRYALGILSMILGGGMSSRLWQEIREKRGLAYYVSAGQDNFIDNGYMYVVAGVNNQKASDAVKVVLEELVRIRDSGVSEKELQRVKDQFEGGMAIGLESSYNVASAYSDSVLSYDRVLTPEDELDKIKKVTLDEVNLIAKDIINNNLSLALIGPFKEEEQFKKILKL